MKLAPARLILMSSLMLGCLAQPTPNQLTPGDYTLSLEHQNLTRHYQIHIPPSYNASTQMPLVIYLHGGGGSHRTAKLDGLNEQADKHGFILAAPAGTGKLENAFLSWNGGDWNCGTRCGFAHENNIDDVGFISKMIDEIALKASVDKKRVFATGISNGALITIKLACELSEKITAFAPIALIAIPNNCTPTRPVAIMYVHGTKDLCTPFEGGTGTCIGMQANDIASAQAKVEQLKAKINCAKIGTESYKNNSALCTSFACESGTELAFCKVDEMGHAFPSGAQYLPERVIGPVSHDLSFDQIWKFFERNSMK